MRVALLSDIHSNIVALEAVMKEIKRHNPEKIVSLGDQINLGPSPRETLALLKAEGVLCLHGNHERYVLSAMAGDPEFAGANFQSLRFNAQLLSAAEITFPWTYSIGCATLTHAMPDDDRFPVHDISLAAPRLLAQQRSNPVHIICGHGHNPTYYALPNMTVQSIGSVGCMDDAIPGIAPYVIAEIDEQMAALKPYYAQYDVRKLKPLFVSGGMAEFCPIMARIACMEMTHNREYLVDFVRRAARLSKSRGEEKISRDSWVQTDREYPWADGLSTAEFWKR